MIRVGKAGLAAARARGRKGSRPKLLDERKVAMAQALYDSGEHSMLYRYIDAG